MLMEYSTDVKDSAWFHKISRHIHYNDVLFSLDAVDSLGSLRRFMYLFAYLSVKSISLHIRANWPICGRKPALKWKK